MEKRRLILSVIALVALGVSFHAVAQETIKVGYIIPMTGPASVFGLTAVSSNSRAVGV